MKLTCLLLFTSAIASDASLRGSLEKENLKSVEGWGQLKCMFEAFSDKEKCADATNDDGEPCSYCVMQGGGDDSGLCVDPQVAPQMEAINPSISCDPDADADADTRSQPASASAGVAVEGWGQLKCMFEAFSDEEKCADATNEDGAKCSYCVIKGASDGEEAGLCVDPGIAPEMEQMNPAISCDSDVEEEEEEGASQSVEGWGQLKCMLEAFSSKEKCADATNDDGEPCSYCVMEGGGQEAGLCVDPEVAPNMEQMNPAISCSSETTVSSTDTVAEEGLGFDYHDYKCSIKALTDASLCAETKTQGGEENCEYCTVDGPFGKTGLCVSPEHAEMLKGFNPDVECSSSNAVSIAMK